MIPDGVALRIVGDVHGDLRAFEAAVSTDRFIIQLGDLSDHGPDSAWTLLDREGAHVRKSWPRRAALRPPARAMT